jgi:hypothetical protein
MKDQVAALCLLRAGCSEGLTATTFKTDIKPLLGYRMGPGELRQAEQEARALLQARGMVVRAPRSRSRLGLSEAGRREAAVVLGLKAWPTKDPSWARLVVAALAGRALGLTAMEFGKLTRIEALRREILRRLCGRESLPARLAPADIRQASEAVGAVRNDKVEVQRRLALRGAEELRLTPATDDTAAFADEVLRIARKLRTGRVGRDLVFVNHVWRAFLAAHPESKLDLPRFKDRLRDAWRARKMPLAIANVLDPQLFSDVLESRIDDGRQEWHVIDLAAA